VRREIRRFYAPGVVGEVANRGPLAWYLDNVACNGGRLFLQGAAIGVGASTLVRDYAASYNLNAQAEGLPEIGYVDVVEGCKTAKHLIDTIAAEVGLRISPSILRYQSPRSLVSMLVGHMALRGFGTLIIDHVSNAGGEARSMLAGLFRAVNPRSPGGSRLGIVLVDHERPTLLFRQHVRVLIDLQGDTITLDRYRKPADMAVAVEQADIGFAGLDCSNTDTKLAMEVLLEMTHGLPVFMARAFEHLDMLHQRYPTQELVTLVHAIPNFMRQQVKMRIDADFGCGERVVTMSAINRKPLAPDGPASCESSELSEGQKLTPTGRACRAPRKQPRESRQQSLQRRERQHEVAERDRGDLLKRSFVSMPTHE
jgi:hypothetical protein